jgi:signal transduction histidine kinase
LFGSDLWNPALDKFADATGLSVELFGLDERVILGSTTSTPLVALFHEFGYEPDLFSESARRCLRQTVARPVVLVDELPGLSVIGTSLVLNGRIVGAAVAGYALARFPNVDSIQRWAKTAKIPFDRLWKVVRRLSPVPERRLLLNGELLQILGDALLRENYRTRKYEDAAVELEAASMAKDDFLAVVSHELRAPLGPILNWTGVLKTNVSPQVREAAEVIERNVLLESRLIEDLLDLNQVRRGALQLDLGIHDVKALIRAALETSAHDIEVKAIRLELVEGDGPLLAEGDAVRLQQVFGNVISNAVKFTPEGGRIGVTIHREKDRASVVVADSGVGIAAEFLPHVFDVFQRQEQDPRHRVPGLGIGLSLVKRLTELHRGTVSVESAGLGKGTEVRVELPLATDAQPDTKDDGSASK